MKTLFLIVGIIVIFVNNSISQEISIIDKLDKPPSFEGGVELLDKYIQKHITQPKLGANIAGTALLSFKVDSLGRISDVKIIRTLFQSFEEEIIPIILNMPDWIPGEIHGIKVDSIVYMSIRFRT